MMERFHFIETPLPQLDLAPCLQSTEELKLVMCYNYK